MFEVLQTSLVAAVLFAATNADDLLLLTILFARRRISTRAVVSGQLAGIGALAAISYAAATALVAVPRDWLPWLGLAPLVIGVRWLRRADTETEAPSLVQWWAVAGIVLAHGGDNLGVYIPVFAVQTGVQTALTGLVFAVLTLGWCWLAWAATRHPTWGPTVCRVCRHAGPYVLVAVGLWIVGQHPFFGLARHGSP